MPRHSAKPEGKTTKISKQRHGKIDKSPSAFVAPTGWICPICESNAIPERAYTQMDERYQLGQCKKHGRVALIRGTAE